MSEKAMRVDTGGFPIPSWRKFSTAKHTISADATREEIVLGDDVAEIVLESDANFIYAESETAAGNSKKKIQLGVVDMNSVWVEGAVGQVVEITKGLL
jgi:hypothetical protein